MRLDLYLTENNIFKTRTKSAEAIKKGLVSVNGKICEKPSKEVLPDDIIIVSGDLKFVSRGGYKLDKALNDFSLNPSGMVFADIGASTGGFTDALIQRNVKLVFAVDVGENQLDENISTDTRVVVMDKTNARYLTRDSFSERLDGIVADCSFISLKILLPIFSDLLDESGILLALIKPQFECGKKDLPKSGILHNEKTRAKVVLDVISAAKQVGFIIKGITEAPIYSDKNIEYIVYFAKCGNPLSGEKILKVLKG